MPERQDSAACNARAPATPTPQVVQADGVKCALHVVSTQLQFVKPAKKKAKKGAGDAGSGGPKKADRVDPSAPPNYSEIAVCNAAGLLHHLTFLDLAKEQVRAPCSSSLLP